VGFSRFEERTMDRLQELQKLSGQIGAPYVSLRRAQSAFVLRSAEIMSQILAFETLLRSVFAEFVDYHGYYSIGIKESKDNISAYSSGMSDIDRSNLNEEIAKFIAAASLELKEMRSMEINNENSKDDKSHNQEMQSFLTSKLANLTKQSQNMNKERVKMMKNDDSFNFYGKDDVHFTDEQICVATSISTNSNFDENMQKQSLVQRMAYRSGVGIKGDNDNDDTNALDSDFAVRYEGQIAPASQLQEYENIAIKHKKALLSEAKIMNVKYSEELQQVKKIENTVNNVGNLMTEFANVLSSQSEQLANVNEESKAATAHVQSSSDELQLTIDRTENHSKNIVYMSVGLALVLLLLDFITP